MEKGREGRDSGSEVWGGGKGGTAKEVVVTSMRLGGGGRRRRRSWVENWEGREVGTHRTTRQQQAVSKCTPMHVCESTSKKTAVFIQWNSS